MTHSTGVTCRGDRIRISAERLEQQHDERGTRRRILWSRHPRPLECLRRSVFVDDVRSMHACSPNPRLYRLGAAETGRQRAQERVVEGACCCRRRMNDGSARSAVCLRLLVHGDAMIATVTSAHRAGLQDQAGRGGRVRLGCVGRLLSVIPLIAQQRSENTEQLAEWASSHAGLKLLLTPKAMTHCTVVHDKHLQATLLRLQFFAERCAVHHMCSNTLLNLTSQSR